MAPMGDAPAFPPPPPLLAGTATGGPLPGHSLLRHAAGLPVPAQPLARPPAGRRPRPPLPVVARWLLSPPPSTPSPPPMPPSSLTPTTAPRMAHSPPPPPLLGRRAVLAAALATAAATTAAAVGAPRAAAAAEGPSAPAVATATSAGGAAPTHMSAAGSGGASPRSSSPPLSPSNPMAAALQPAAVPAIGVTLRVPPAWGRDTVVTTARFVSATGGHGPSAAWQNVADPRENLSVVVAPVSPGASLGSIGPPAAFGRRLAATLSVPVGAAGLVRSGLGAAAPMARRAVLLMARSRGEVRGGGAATATATATTAPTATTVGATAATTVNAAMAGGGSDQGLYYEIEYEVITPMWRRRNISAVCIKHDRLYTLNVQAPGERWEELAPMMRAVAASFSVQ
ncbi:hypothetical protein I4F81_003633 [Pyropia yezoensis]|uniref:Uncharacterized protein n=1 Tax=Pyropia yezoensis TaxID=2788 RepID=A0ACC3BSQ6_PYRYE|nr:hypothetical protein I4F81_003633 [Neopyropia yezoensis]